MHLCLPFLLFALASESAFGGPGDGKETAGAPAPQLPDAAAVREALDAGRFDMSGWWQQPVASKAAQETGFRFYMKIERGQPDGWVLARTVGAAPDFTSTVEDEAPGVRIPLPAGGLPAGKAVVWKVDEITAMRDGKMVRAWKAGAADESLVLAASDAAVLVIRMGQREMVRATEGDVEDLLKRAADRKAADAVAAAKGSRPRNWPAALPAAAGTVVFAGAIPVPSDEVQKVMAAKSPVEVRLLNPGHYPLTDEGIDSFVRKDAALTSHPVMKKIVAAARGEGRDEPWSVVAAAVVALQEQVARVEGAPAAPLPDALKAGAGSPVVWTRLLVELCRQLDIPAREVHGFFLPPGAPRTERRIWIEILDTDSWLAVDPAVRLDPNTVPEPELLPDPCDSYLPAPLTARYVRIARGIPDPATEKVLDSRPALLRCEMAESEAPDEASPLPRFLPPRPR